jgi:hypothetical protein
MLANDRNDEQQMNPFTNIGELINTLAAIVHGFGELFQAMRTILRLIGTLGRG